MNLKNCKLCQFDKNLFKEMTEFDCGNDDLNDFFHNDALNYSNELLGKTYCYAYYPAIAFYEKNGFQFLYKGEKDEKEQNGFSAEEKLRTRSMFFDLGILR
jgi:hypothetical protein